MQSTFISGFLRCAAEARAAEGEFRATVGEPMVKLRTVLLTIIQ